MCFIYTFDVNPDATKNQIKEVLGERFIIKDRYEQQDEVFHIMGSATIGEHHKRVALYNVGGFWDECMRMLAKMNQAGFIRGNLSDYVVIVNNINELNQLCEK